MSSPKSSVKMNVIYQILYQVLTLILPFITSPYIARVIGADGLGIYSFTYSIAYYFVLFSMLGIANHGNRVIARARENQQEMECAFSDLLFVHVSVSVICTAAYIIYCLFVKTDKVYAWIQLAYVISGVLDISWFYFGIEQIKITVIRNAVIKLLSVISLFAFVREPDDLWIYCCILSFSALLGQVSLWIPLRKYVKIRKPDLHNAASYIKPLLVMFIPTIAISLYKYMDKIMLGIMCTKTQLGFYENAEKINNIPIAIIGSFGTVMLPKMSNLSAKGDSKGTSRYMKLSMQYIMCVALAMAFGLFAVGQVFAPVFWGDEFVISGKLIQYLSITIPVIAFANIIRTQYLIPNNKDKEYIISVIAGAVVNLICNVVFIPMLDAVGACIGTVAAEITVCGIQYFYVRKALPMKQYLKSFAVFVPAGIVMFAVVFFLGKNSTVNISTLLLQVLTGAAIYGIITVCYLYVIKDETFMNILSHLHLKKGKR
ncbi:MAG: flippase [Oscillospiraceae bacterium]|nr:flippase [Oscillospiraceae bacterium]